MQCKMSFNKLLLFSVDCCLLTTVVPVRASDLFGWSWLLLGGLTSALITSAISLVVFFLIPIKHVGADTISSGGELQSIQSQQGETL